MPTNVRTDGKNLVTQFGMATVVQPADPVLLKPKGDPGVALHTNNSAKINNPAGTVYDHGTAVAHSQSYMGMGMHLPIVMVGRNTGQVNGDNGFLSWMKGVYIESRNVVMHGVDTAVNALWSMLPKAVQNAVQNGESIVGGMKVDDFADAAKDDAQQMIDALMSRDTLIALVQTAAMMGAAAIPVVGEILDGVAAVQRIKAVVEQTQGAAEELKSMVDRWTQPMSPEQLAAERKKLASWLIRVGVSLLLVALGKAVKKISAKAKGKENSTKEAEAGTGPKAKETSCACATGRPVIIATGEKKLANTDFALPGLIPLAWERHYRSGDARSGWFGQGWTVPLAVTLSLGAEQLRYHDAAGRLVDLPALAVGAEHFDAYEQFTLRRPGEHDWEIAFKNGLTQYYRRPREDWFLLPLAAMRDRNGNQIQFEYPMPPDDPFEAWRPDRIIDSVGRRLQLAWNAEGRLTEIVCHTDAWEGQRLARYEYDDQGDLATHIDSIGSVRRYEWRNHVLTAYTLADGAHYCAEYDEYSPAGRVVHSYAAADGRGHRFAYNDRARTTSVTDSLGRTTVYEYNERRDIVATTFPDGTRNETPFDSNGNPRASVDALGRSTQYQFDERGNLASVVDAAGAASAFRYNELDLPIKVVDALGHAWTSEYDERGNLLGLTDPLGQANRYAYDARGLPHQLIDARHGVKRLEWDSKGNLAAYTDCSDKRTRFHYDDMGRLLSSTDALGQTTRFTWDAAGRLLHSESADGAIHRYEWSAGGKLLSYTDALGAITRYRYNAHGEPVERVDANGYSLRYDYDASGRLIALTNENGETTRFDYDIADRLTDEIGFDGRHQRYIYNAAGELTHLVEAGGSEFGPGKATCFARDALGRLVARIAEDDSDATARYVYDPLGRLLEATNPAAALTFAYDPLGRLLNETQTLAGNEPRSLAHQYDVLGNRIQTTLPDQRTINWLYYGSGHLHQINLETAGVHQTIVDIERDALHRERSRTQGALTSQYDYDPMGRLQRHRALHGSQAAAVAVERQYRYDIGGNLISRIDSLRGEQQFRYDPTGRILSAKGLHDEIFAFDPAGNLLNQGSSSKIKGNRVETYQDLRYEYDIHGNVTRRSKGASTDATLRWNAAHQLIEAIVTRNGVTQSTRYEYDALGRRTRKADTFGATEFLWDGAQMIASSRGAHQSLFIFESRSLVPVATIQNNAIYWYQCDQIGTPMELTDKDAHVVWSAEYRAWGESSLHKTGTNGATQLHYERVAMRERPMPEQPFRFQGQWYDEETGLHYNRFRHYDPAIGRFVSADPVGLRGGLNLYAYAPNALTYIDPFGLSSAALDKKLGGRKGDCYQAHHLIPEEVMKDPRYKSMFDKLKSMGFDPDGAGNGIHLPGNQQLAQETGLPGHWSSHDQFTTEIKGEVENLYNDWKRKRISDTQLALGTKDIQNRAKTGLENGRFQVAPNCRLL